ncbi:MAG: family 20 glycosylhydrolase [Bacteroidales bacterium]|nr:family 20 glycosylhydrolase [Bacteroidales bacterium]
MKKLYLVLIFALMQFQLSLFAQNTGIIPTPQKVEFHDGHYALTSNQEPVIVFEKISTFPVDTNADQGYILEVTPSKILIQATTETGLFYGEQSLKQLMAHNRDKYSGEVRIPCMRIVDYPLMKYRGWMDDISRGPIPNMDFLKTVIATFAQYKLNFFNLYTEHVFKLDEYPDIAPTDGLTAAQIKELEEYAAQYHIEIFGNQQCLAHAEKTLRIPFYQDIADNRTNYNPGNEKTYDFLKYQLETVANAYESEFFNIDCDETEALGTGKARHFVEQGAGASQVYADHIQRVYNILKPLGKRVMMWGDIAAKDSVITAQLPKDMLMIVWSYGPADSYEGMIAPFVKQGLDFMVAPGMSMWSTVYPSYETYTKNIANLIRDGYRNGALGMMNTAWDDSGESLFNSTWHGMAWAAEMAWKPIVNTQLEMAENERTERLQTFDRNYAVFDALPADYFKQIRSFEHTQLPNFFNTSALYDNVLDFYDSKVTSEYFQENVNVNAELDVYRKHYIEPYLKDCSTMPLKNTAMARIAHYVAVRQQVVVQKNILRYMLYRMMQGDETLAIKANNGKSHLDRMVPLNQNTINQEIMEVLNLLHQAKKEYMVLWDEDSRPYSRDIVEKRFDKVAQELLDIPNHVFITVEPNEKGETVVTLNTLFNDQKIYYTIDGRRPMKGDRLYEHPFVLPQTSLVRALTKNSMQEDVINEQYVLIHKGLQKISRLNTEFSTYQSQYAAAGKMALADGIVGGDAYGDGTWQGYWGKDIEVDFDFGKSTTIQFFKTRFFQNIYDWIMAPNTVEIYTSKNGKDFVLYRTLQLQDPDYSSSSTGIYTIQTDDLAMKTRYVRVVVKNAGPLPSWHQAKGQASYIFCDELIFN